MGGAAMTTDEREGKCDRLRALIKQLAHPYSGAYQEQWESEALALLAEVTAARHGFWERLWWGTAGR